MFVRVAISEIVCENVHCSTCEVEEDKRPPFIELLKRYQEEGKFLSKELHLTIQVELSRSICGEEEEFVDSRSSESFS